MKLNTDKCTILHIEEKTHIIYNINTSKVLEIIITETLTNYVFKNKIITNHQHRFLLHRSTTTNFLTCVNGWTKAIDNEEPIDVLYLDYEKAVDKVQHERLFIN